MICKNCGNEIDDNSKFCILCGMNMENKEKEQDPNLYANTQNDQTFQMLTSQPNMVNRPNNMIHNVVHVVMAIIIVILSINLANIDKEYTNLARDYNDVYDAYERNYNYLNDYLNRDAGEKTLDAIQSWFK